MSADYTAWRITYQSSEQAAQAAYRAAQEHLARCTELEAELDTHRSELGDRAERLLTVHKYCQQRGIDMIGGNGTQALMDYCDALAAHVEQQASLLREHFREWEADTGEWDEFGWHDRVAKCLESTPAVSLARLTAEQKAEALEEAANVLGNTLDAAVHKYLLREWAHQIRCQSSSEES